MFECKANWFYDGLAGRLTVTLCFIDMTRPQTAVAMIAVGSTDTICGVTMTEA